MGSPKVSVVVPVYNCVQTLERAIRSVFEQTLAADRIELIAVDDGSTDGSGALLDRLAEGRPGFAVVHEPASGGPGGPRNTGIGRATGEYVFFLDADDWLGPEALERCCAMADANGTDVVVPKYVGVGRRIHPELFKENVEFTTLFDSVPNLYGSITALKLYRRELLERHDIRFPDGVLSGEDQIFAVRAYFEAKGVSVLADYDCYYWVDREDGTSALQSGGAPADLYFAEIERLMDFVAERTSPGPVRDRLLRRHFAIEIFSRFDSRYPASSARERRTTREWARRMVERHGSKEIMRDLPPYARLIDHALRHRMDDLIEVAARVRAQGRPKFVFDEDHVFSAYPGLRDVRLGVPDDVYTVSRPPNQRWTLTGLRWRDGLLVVRGHALAEPLDEASWSGELVLRRRGASSEHRTPFEPVETTGDGRIVLGGEVDFLAAAEGGPLALGRYDFFVSAPYLGQPHQGRLKVRGQDVDLPGGRLAEVSDHSPMVTPYLTKASGALALHVGGSLPALRTEVSVGRPGTLRLNVVAETVMIDGDVPVMLRTLLRHRENEDVRSTMMSVERRPGMIRADCEIDMTGARRGKWDVSYEVTLGSATHLVRAAVPDLGEQRTKGTAAYRTVRGNLSVEYAGGGATRLLRRMLNGASS